MREIFAALSCEWRLAILEILREKGEICRCELVELLPLDYTTLSRHLSILKSAGIIEERREGRKKIIKVRDERVFKIMDMAREMEEGRR